MPRMGRLHVDGGCYHVMGRGIERREIFYTDADKQDFIHRLGKCLETTGISCYAWSVMPNHYHLLLKVSTRPLSDLMRKLLSGFAIGHNRRHNRVGYVFQNRFKSILCDEDEYLLQLIRYIHLNPVKAGLIGNIGALETYPWTSHATLVGNRPQKWLKVDEVLSHFGMTLESARQQYRSFLEIPSNNADLDGGGLIRSYGFWEDVSNFRREHETKIGDERILGDSTFVEKVLRTDAIEVTSPTARKRSDFSLEKLASQICAHFNITTKELLKRDRDGGSSKAKAVIAYLGSVELGASSRELAKRLNLSRSGVYAARGRGEKLVEELNITIDNL